MHTLFWIATALGAPAPWWTLETETTGVAHQAERHAWPPGHIEVVERSLHGLPVHGAPLTLVHAGSVTRAYGAPLSGVSTVDPRLLTAVSAEDAIAQVSGLADLSQRGLLWTPRATLCWWGGGAEVQLAWAVDVAMTVPPVTMRVWVDAARGEVLASRQTSRSAWGLVYEQSPTVSDLIEVELPRLTSEEALDGVYAAARSCDDWTIEPGLFGETSCHAVQRQALPDASGDYVFEPQPAAAVDPFAEVHGYYHVDKIAAWMDERFGFRRDHVMQTTVNFPMANAFYGDFDGDGEAELSFGHVEDADVDFVYDADVVYHEFGHAIVDALAPGLPFVKADAYGMEWVAGSVHEGAADIWSMLLTGDPLTGEYAGSAFERPAIRDNAPDRRCPQDLQGEVHADGMILGTLGYNLMDDPAVGPEHTAALLYGTIPRWGPDITWPVVGESLAEAADELLLAGVLDEAARAAIETHLEASGMRDCGRVVAMDERDATTLYLVNAGLYEDLALIPAGVQLSLDVPEDATAVILSVQDMVGEQAIGWRAHTRVGDAVGHEPVGLAALGLAFAKPVVFDGYVEGERNAELRIPESLWTPGETLYVSFASRNLGGLALLDFQTVRLSVSLSSEGTIVEPEVPQGGCACRTSVDPRGLFWPLASGLVMIGRRRRSVSGGRALGGGE